MKKHVFILLSVLLLGSMYPLQAQKALRGAVASEYTDLSFEALSEGKLNEALEWADKALALTSKDDNILRSLLYLNKAEISYAKGNLQEALEHVTASITNDPRYTFAYDLRGQIYRDLEDYTAAEQDFQVRLSIFSNDGFWTRHSLCQTIVAQGRLDEAFEMANALVSDYPENYLAYQICCDINLFRQEFTSAMEDAVKMLFYYLLYVEEESLIEVLARLFTLSDIDKDYVFNRLRKEDAEYAYEIGIWGLALGALHLYYEENEEALPYLERYFAHKYDHFIARELYTVHEELGNYEKALYYLNYAALGEPEHLPYYIHRGNLLFELGHLDEYSTEIGIFLEKLSTYYLKDRDYLLSIGYSEKAFYYECLENFEDAAYYYGLAINHDSTNVYYYLARGDMYQLLGWTEEAKRDYQTVIAVDSVDYTLAMYAHLALGDTIEAVNYLHKILTSEGIDKTDYYNIACFYSLIGQEDYAMEYLRTSLENGYRELTYMAYDRDLDALRDREDYKALVEEYRKSTTFADTP